MAVCIPLSLNNVSIWGLVEVIGDALRVRLSCDDWDRADLVLGQKVRVGMPQAVEEWLYVAEVEEKPSLVWATLVERLLVPA